MKERPRLLLDASVLVAAAGSMAGASALTLELCRQGAARALASRLILAEAERNIREKLADDALLRFYRLVAAIEVVPPVTTAELAAYQRIIAAKDAHVLGAAEKGRADFLLTLDRRDFFTPTLRAAPLPFRIATPGEFLHLWAE